MQQFIRKPFEDTSQKLHRRIEKKHGFFNTVSMTESTIVSDCSPKKLAVVGTGSLYFYVVATFGQSLLCNVLTSQSVEAR